MGEGERQVSTVGARVRAALPGLAGLVLFLAALEILRVQLRGVGWHELQRDVSAMPRARLVAAIALTTINYLVLASYDLLAFAYVRHPLSRFRIACTAMLAYSISNSVGFAMLSGAAVRFRFYARWGVTTEELTRLVFSYSLTFWLGLFALGGVSLAVVPAASLEALPGHALLRALAWPFALLPVAYVIATVVRREPLRIRTFTLPLPPPRLAMGQLLVSSTDWALAAAVLYVLLPAGSIAFVPFLSMFLVAILAGLASHVPGGLGVFEGVMVLLLAPTLAPDALLAPLIVFRCVYYVAPLSIGLVALVVDELRLRGHHLRRAGAAFSRATEQMAPHAIALATFLAGVVLLFSGATPAAAGRLDRLNRLVPLGLIETSHFLGSVVGAALLILSQGLARRLDAAYFLTLIAIVAGMLASLLKGGDFEEAGVLLVVLLLLWRARPAFDRRAAFFDTRFSPRWLAAVAGALAASIWIGLFAFKHVAYSDELWWQFELRGEASRFLRGSIGAAVVLLLVAFARLVRYAPHAAPAPTDRDLDDARRAIEQQRGTFPFLVYLRDKALVFDADRTAFVMYGVQGRTWVALGDPVGPEAGLNDAIRAFLERADDYGGVPVFYEIGKAQLHRYVDFGMTLLKLGEEARIDLTSFTTEGPRAARYRQAMRRLEKDGGTFRVVETADVPALMPQLRAVSDDWLAAKASAEKGFSMGFFDEAYLAHFPIGVIECGARVVAFANIWAGPAGDEVSIDLMRYHRDAPKNVMEALLVHLIQWGHQAGYRRFALGMAPLSGFESSPVASLWTRLGAYLYEHGESIYSFQGLRAYKEKFDPAWEPRYLAYPGGLRLPRILTDVTALVAGGYLRIFRK